MFSLSWLVCADGERKSVVENQACYTKKASSTKKSEKLPNLFHKIMYDVRQCQQRCY